MRDTKSGENGEALLVTLAGLLVGLFFGLNGPVVEWIVIGDVLPIRQSDPFIARWLFGAYAEGQYASFLLWMFVLSAVLGLIGAVIAFRPTLHSIMRRLPVDIHQAGKRFLAAMVVVLVVAFLSGSLVAFWAGTDARFGIPFGYTSLLSLEIWSGGMVGLCALTTALGGLAVLKRISAQTQVKP